MYLYNSYSNTGYGGTSTSPNALGTFNPQYGGLYSMMGDADSEAEHGAFQDCINKLKG